MSLLKPEGILVRESEWMRVYRSGPHTFSYWSKFLTDGLQISAEEVSRRWASLSESEQLELAQAFAFKGDCSGDDGRILRFLMRNGSALIRSAIACPVAKHVERELALEFLLLEIAPPPAAPDGPREVNANFYQALEALGDERAVPALRFRFDDYRKRLAPMEDLGPFSELTSYQSCCLALWSLDRGFASLYEGALAELLTHPSEAVRSATQRLIAEKKMADAGSEAVRRAARQGSEQLRELAGETEWSRFYRQPSGHLRRVSKFWSDGLEISPAAIHARWPELRLEEQVEFAQAFAAKRFFSENDLAILQSLLEQDIEYIRATVCIHLRHRPERERIVARLLGAIDPDLLLESDRAANCYEALASLGATEAVPILKRRCAAHRTAIDAAPVHSLREMRPYLRCCHALWLLDGAPAHAAEIRALHYHADAAVSRYARELLP